ncbi:insulinase family protein [Serratia ureilytica]
MTLAASWQLDNGLAVRAISTPDAEAAAALVRIEAGSFQAPAAWPGLAHLLEHMLFRGSVNFNAQDGLMGWTPAVGGRLNATTQATQTAFSLRWAPNSWRRVGQADRYARRPTAGG